jgi:hypothetical protein
MEPEWEGFTEIGMLGKGCTAALAKEPAKAMGPMKFVPCTSGEACEELAWDGAVKWAPAGEDMLVFDVRFVNDERGFATHLLLRHHYPIGDNYGPNPYEAVLYDLSTGAPVAVVRNLGTRDLPPENGTVTIGGPECLVVPVSSPKGMWLVGAVGHSDSTVLTGYLPLDPPQPILLPPTMRQTKADATFRFNEAFAFDDRLVLSSNDGKLVAVGVDGVDTSVLGPGQRVWLSGLVGDRVLTVNDKGTVPKYFTLDRAMQFTEYGSGQKLYTDGTNVAFWTETDVGIEAWTASASDGKPKDLLTTIPNPMGDTLSVLGAVLGDGAFALLTRSNPLLSTSTAITAHVIDLSTGAHTSAVVLQNVKAFDDPPAFLGYAQRYFWFRQESSSNSVEKIVRIKAPGPS